MKTNFDRQIPLIPRISFNSLENLLYFHWKYNVQTLNMWFLFSKLEKSLGKSFANHHMDRIMNDNSAFFFYFAIPPIESNIYERSKIL